MLPRTQRVTTSLVQEIMKNGLTFQAPHVSLRAIKLKTEQLARFSFSLSKKIEKTAVGRNKIKRRGNAILRRHRSSLPKGTLGIFFGKSGVQFISVKELEEEILALIKRA